MKVKYSNSRGIDVLLTKDESEELFNPESKYFQFAHSLRFFSPEAGAFFSLSRLEQNEFGRFLLPCSLEGGAQIVLPAFPKDSYLINIPFNSEAARRLREENKYSSHYLSGQKLLNIVIRTN